HYVGKGLLDVHILAGADRLYAVLSMLKVGGGDDDRVDVLHSIKLVGIAGLGKLLAAKRNVFVRGFLCNEIGALVSAPVPYVANRDRFEVHLVGKFHKCRNEGVARPVPGSDERHPNPVVSAADLSVTEGT